MRERISDKITDSYSDYVYEFTKKVDNKTLDRIFKDSSYAKIRLRLASIIMACLACLFEDDKLIIKDKKDG